MKPDFLEITPNSLHVPKTAGSTQQYPTVLNMDLETKHRIKGKEVQPRQAVTELLAGYDSHTVHHETIPKWTTLQPLSARKHCYGRGDAYYFFSKVKTWPLIIQKQHSTIWPLRSSTSGHNTTCEVLQKKWCMCKPQLRSTCPRQIFAPTEQWRS